APDSNRGVFVPAGVFTALTGRSGLQQATVTLADGVDPDRWILDRGPAFGSTVEVRSTAAQARRAQASIKPVQDSFAAVAGVALFVGAYLVYLTMSTSVEERSRTHGVLRAIGASRRQVVRLVLAEAAAI